MSYVCTTGETEHIDMIFSG